MLNKFQETKLEIQMLLKSLKVKITPSSSFPRYHLKRENAFVNVNHFHLASHFERKISGNWI